MPQPDPWPALPYEDWAETLSTLHRWTQVVGKIRLASSPWINHSWHTTLRPTPVGMATPVLHQGARSFDIEFDFLHDELVVRTGEGVRRSVKLEPRSVASFHAELMGLMEELGFRFRFHPAPNEVPDPVPFAEDTEHGSYDPDAVRRFSQALNQSARVFTDFRARFLGKCSPVHFFWGSFDLAVTRFSGRRAPRHPGGFPALPDWVTREAYSHEVCSAGFWPGGESSPAPAYYAYAYPVPKGCAAAAVGPEQAFWSEQMGEWFLPYDAVRTADDPDAALMEFLESTWEAVADLGSWPREELEVGEDWPQGS